MKHVNINMIICKHELEFLHLFNFK